VWALLGDFARRVKEHPGLYRQLVQQSAGMVENGRHANRSGLLRAVERDIHRTYPQRTLCFMMMSKRRAGRMERLTATTTNTSEVQQRVSGEIVAVIIFRQKSNRTASVG
jgi:hypothetical protein